MAKIPRVEHFLLCYPLRSGILFLTSLTIVIHTLHLLILAFMYDGMMARLNFPQRTDLQYLPEPSTSYSIQAGHNLAVGLAVIIINVLVIIGVLYKKPNFLRPWLGLCGLGLVLEVLALIAVPICFAIFLPAVPAMTAGLFFLILIIFGCHLHVFCVVHTYYKELKESKEIDMVLVPQDPLKVPYSKMA